MKNIFAVDIGGSKTLCAVTKENGEILDSRRADYSRGYTADMLIEIIKDSYKSLKHLQIDVCSIAVPGLCNHTDGTWIYSPFSGISSIPIASIISEITDLEVFADNDVNISALAEREFGICRGIDDYLWITVSNGIGGGLVLDGKLYRGVNMASGEIGHITVEENTDRICGCGKKGCLEIMASGASIADIYAKKTGICVNGAFEVAKRAKDGDGDALSVFEKAGAYIGKAAASAINLLGIKTVVIGGGVSEEFGLFKDSAEASMKQYIFSQANQDAKILRSSLGKNAALLGCVALVKEKKQ